MSLLRRLAGSIWMRGAVTLVLLAYVARRIDWSTAADRLEHGSWGWFAASVGLLGGAIALGAVRWQVLLRGADIRVPNGLVARIYVVGTFASNFLPTTIGGDVARALCIARSGPRLTRTVISILVDRAAGLVGLAAVAWLAYLAAQSLPSRIVGPLIWVTAGCVVVGIVAALALLGGRRLRFLVPARMTGLARDLRTVLAAYATNPGLVAATLVLSMALQALVVASTGCLARAVGVELSFTVAAATVLVAQVLTMLPISIAGFGIRESSFVALLGSAGISATDATLISVLTVVAVAVSSLPGAFVLVRSGLPAAASPDPVP